jgi:hypothetical protein
VYGQGKALGLRKQTQFIQEDVKRTRTALEYSQLYLKARKFANSVRTREYKY